MTAKADAPAPEPAPSDPLLPALYVFFGTLADYLEREAVLADVQPWEDRGAAEQNAIQAGRACFEAAKAVIEVLDALGETARPTSAARV